MVSTFWLINIGMTREGYAAQGLRHAFLPAIVSTSGRIHGQLLRLLFNLADKKTSNSISGACEPPLAWRARKPLPWALRSSAALALGIAMPRALSPFVSRRGLFNTNQRISLLGIPTGCPGHVILHA